MKNCKLCNINVADKKGSHIVPHFILKRIDNIDQQKKRDYELGFFIEEFDTKSYFGRSVSPEKIESLFGVISDKKLHKHKSPLIVDYFFCHSCEQRLAVIEGEYSKTIKVNSNTLYDSKIRSELGLLFWASILWRISINKKNGLQITISESERLRRILNDNLKPDISNIDLENIRNSIDFNKISYKLLRCPNYSLKNPTYLLFYPYFKKTYTLLIDEYILFFSFNGKFEEYKNKDFFGIKDEVFSTPLNNINSNEYILPISVEKLKDLNAGVLKHTKEIREKLIDIFLH